MRAERDLMGHRGALHDPYVAAAWAGEEYRVDREEATSLRIGVACQLRSAP